MPLISRNSKKILKCCNCSDVVTEENGVDNILKYSAETPSGTELAERVPIPDAMLATILKDLKIKRCNENERRYLCFRCSIPFTNFFNGFQVFSKRTSLKSVIARIPNCPTPEKDALLQTARKTGREARKINTRSGNKITCKSKSRRFQIHTEKFVLLQLDKLKVEEFPQNSFVETFSCRLCFRQFPSQELMETHMECAHEKIEKPFYCKICKRRFAFRWFYFEHKAIHGEGKRICQCKACTSKHHSINSNKISKSSQRPTVCRTIGRKSPFKCNQCPGLNFFENIYRLRRHLIAQHKGTEEAKAASCNRLYSQKAKSLSSVTMRNKIPEGSRNCHICEEKCKSIFILNRHLQDVHNLENICKICEQRFSSALKLTKHEKCHKIPFCSECKDEMTATRRDYYDKVDHFERFHVTKYLPNYQLTCELCGKIFRGTHQLFVHYKWHEREVNDQFTCEVCEKTFRHKAILDAHILGVHEQKRKKFPCSECSRYFYCRSVLERHLIDEHKKDCEFKCDICEKRFLRKETVARHIGKVHNLPKFGQGPKPNLLSGEYKKFDLKKCFCETDRLFKCPECPMQFGGKNHFLRHLPRHRNLSLFYSTDGDGLLTCSVCKEKAKDRHELEVHLRVHLKGNRSSNQPYHTEVRHQCEFCQKIYIRKRFREHWKDHKEAKKLDYIKRIKEAVPSKANKNIYVEGGVLLKKSKR